MTHGVNGKMSSLVLVLGNIANPKSKGPNSREELKETK